MFILVYLTILDTIINSLVVNYFTGKNIRKNYWKYGLFIVLATTFSYLTTSFILVKGLDIVINVIFFTLLWSYLFKIKLIPVLIAECLAVILINAIELPAASFLATSTGETIFNAINNLNLFMVIVGTTCKLIEFALIILIYQFKSEFLKKFDIKVKNISAMPVVIFQIFMFVLIIIMITSKLENIQHALIIFIFYILISAIIFTVYLFDQRDKEKIYKLECLNDIHEKTIELVEASISSIRKEKHDFNNHLNTILAFCVNHENSPLANKIHSYILELTNLYLNEKIKPDTGCEYLDALLVAKYHYAKLSGIKLKFNFEYKLYELEKNTRELVGIYGNIIDNAIDAFKSKRELMVLEQLGETDYFIELDSIAKGKNLILNFKNNAPAIEHDKLNKIFELNYSTKCNDLKTRGFGLAIVKESVSDLGGSINVASSNEITIFKVILDGRASVNQKNDRKLG